jgi:hypothetical protein
MTTLVINLPDELEDRARRSGLLFDGAIQELPEDALRRQAGRRLREVAHAIHIANIPPMTMEEIDVEVEAIRALRPRE